MATQAIFTQDLAGIEVGETSISEVNGQSGQLSYRGYPIAGLVEKPFWQVVWLLLFGSWPDLKQESALHEFMALHGNLDKSEQAMLGKLPGHLHPMLMLQGMVPLLNLEPRCHIDEVSTTAEAGLIIAAKLPSLVAAWRQLETNGKAIHVNCDASFHENFLMMFNGCVPLPEQVRTLDAAQILQLEHSYNAGTFAGRVCASTHAPIQSSISASIGTLFGVLHGGADQAALEMAEKISAPENAEAYVQECLEKNVKIMGMGHREYRVLDPRAKLLKPMAKSLCGRGDAERLFNTLVAVEDACQQSFQRSGKEIWANVEFYKGAVFYQLGIPPKYFTTLFSMARIYGYIAHFLEFSETSKLIRPRARYIGNRIQSA
jgi:citrate synthase